MHILRLFHTYKKTRKTENFGDGIPVGKGGDLSRGWRMGISIGGRDKSHARGSFRSNAYTLRHRSDHMMKVCVWRLRMVAYGEMRLNLTLTGLLKKESFKNQKRYVKNTTKLSHL